MSAKLSDQVVDKRRRCIDLRDQRGGLTAPVLESLRTFLRYNDLYIHLSVSDNLLNSEALAELCTLVKRHPYLASIEAQHCGLQDKDFCFYFGPALISMQRLTFLDLSRNSGLTDTCADTVARLLQETELESIRLVGTSLTAAGGRIIAAAAANTTALLHCELPYTVGSAVLDAVDAHTRRNRAHRERLNEASLRYARLQLGHCRPPSLPGLRRLAAPTAPVGVVTSAALVVHKRDASTLSLASPMRKDGTRSKSVVSPTAAMSPGGGAEDREWRACVSKGRRRSWVRPDPAVAAAAAEAAAHSPADGLLLKDGSNPTYSSTSSTIRSSPGVVSGSRRSMASPFPPTPLPSVTRRAKATPDTLDSVTMWDWADPAMSTTLRCLFVLDHQAQALDHTRAAPSTSAGSTAAGTNNTTVESARRSRGRSSGRDRVSARYGSSEGRSADAVGLPPLWTP